eukprot:s5216_g4.t3
MGTAICSLEPAAFFADFRRELEIARLHLSRRSDARKAHPSSDSSDSVYALLQRWSSVPLAQGQGPSLGNGGFMEGGSRSVTRVRALSALSGEVLFARTLPSNTLCDELRQLLAASRGQSSETVQLLLNGVLLARDTLTIEGAVFEHGQCADGALEFSAVLEPSLKRFPLERCERTPGLYVSEVNNHRVTRWDLEGGGRIVVGGFGRGSGLGQLAGPKGLCFDEHGVCYVAEAGNRRVTRWCPREGRGALAGGGQTVVGDGGECDRGGELEEPGGICLGHSGELYVADVRGHAVSCWNQEFQDPCVVAGGRGPGDGLDQLDRPVDVAVDSKGFLYVAEFSNDRVTRWKDKTGEVIAGGRGSGDALEQLSSPTAICLQESKDGVRGRQQPSDSLDAWSNLRDGHRRWKRTRQ